MHAGNDRKTVHSLSSSMSAMMLAATPSFFAVNPPDDIIPFISSVTCMSARTSMSLMGSSLVSFMGIPLADDPTYNWTKH